MSRERLLQLSAISTSHPNLEALGRAFTQHLPSKPHPLPSVAALGEMVFYYEHRPGEVSENETNTQQLQIQGRASAEGG